MRQLLLPLLLLTVLSGCATKITTPVPAPPVRDPAAASLDRAISVPTGSAKVGVEAPAAKPVYGTRTSVSFLGDAAVLLKNVADSGSGWKFEQVGPPPYLPIYVQVNVKDASFQDFLQNIADQLAQRADIELGAKRITLRYRANN